jgi:hypothetical protein
VFPSVGQIPGLPSPAPDITGKSSTSTGTTYDISQAGQSGKYSTGTSGRDSSSSSSSTRSETNTYYYSDNESIFSIYKYIEGEKDKNFLGDIIKVTVRILCKPEGRQDDVLLKEESSPNHILISEDSPKYIILNDLINESINEFDQNNWKTFERKSNRSIYSKINTIYPGSWIIYTYNLELNQTGWNNIYTIIKYYDAKKKSHIPNYAYHFDRIYVEKEILSLDITVTKDKKIISPDENLCIGYEIKYIGENREPFPINVRLDENNMNIFRSNNSNTETLNLSQEYPAKFYRIINFSKSNDYTAPKLIINELPYEIRSGDSEITVQTWDKRNSEYIYWLLQVLGLVIAFGLGYREFRNLEATISRVGKEIKRIRLLAEKYDKHLDNLKYIKNRGKLDEDKEE